MKFVDSQGRDRVDRMLHYLYGFSTIVEDGETKLIKYKYQMKKRLKEINERAKVIEDVKKKAQAEVDVLHREVRHTPSRKHKGKHDIRQDSGTDE